MDKIVGGNQTERGESNLVLLNLINSKNMP